MQRTFPHVIDGGTQLCERASGDVFPKAKSPEGPERALERRAFQGPCLQMRFFSDPQLIGSPGPAKRAHLGFAPDRCPAWAPLSAFCLLPSEASEILLEPPRPLALSALGPSSMLKEVQADVSCSRPAIGSLLDSLDSLDLRIPARLAKAAGFPSQVSRKAWGQPLTGYCRGCFVLSDEDAPS